MVTPWPCEIGDADPDLYHPTVDLFAIIQRANYHAGDLRTLVISNACDCARDHAITKAGTSWNNATQHCEWIRLARNRADADNWIGCIDALKHLNGPPASTQTNGQASVWPCVPPANGDPDEDLFATIERANTHAPIAKALVVIDKACACSAHPQQQGGTEWSTVKKHVEWCSKARVRALAGGWQLCIDALDHIGGGGGEDDEGLAVEAVRVVDFLAEFLGWLRDSERFELIRKKLPEWLPEEKA